LHQIQDEIKIKNNNNKINLTEEKSKKFFMNLLNI